MLRFNQFFVWLIPIILMSILGYAQFKKVKIYETFIIGAREGLTTIVRLLPYIIAIFSAIALFRQVLSLLPFPRGIGDLLMLGILKPLSGAAALSTTAEILNTYGADSRIGIAASIMQGSCETVFYVISLYLGSVNIKQSRNLLTVGLCSEVVVFLFALTVSSFFGSL